MRIANDGTELLQVNVLTDNYSTETSWTVVNTASGVTAMSALVTSYTNANTEYSVEDCVPEAQCK